MAINTANLTLLADGNGFHLYYYDGGTDTLATIMASDYFNNEDDDLNLGADDQIMVKAADGFQTIRVDTVTAATGVVTTEMGAGESQLVTALLANVSSASSVFIAAPFDGKIRRFKTVLQGAITTGDAAVGLEIGGTDVTGGQVTIANSGSAAGDVDETEATAANTVTEGQAVEIDTDGGSTNAVGLLCMVEFVPA